MSSACSQALGLPEIVAAIMELLEDANALFAALQVNKLWADEATTVLWRVQPPLGAFVHINDVETLRYYAKKVSSLKFEGARILGYYDIWKACQKLQGQWFTCLTRISAIIEVALDEEALVPYLPPNLNSLELTGFGPISDTLLMQIEVLCPNLRNFSFCAPPGKKGIQTCDLLRFLNGMPTLTSIYLRFGLENIISDKVHTHLASRPNLLVLELPYKRIVTEDFWGISAAVEDPFPKLIYLSCLSTCKGFSCLSRHLRGLKSLKLGLLSTSGDVIFAISNCINLASIELAFRSDSYVPAGGLLSVAKNCPHLRVLDLHVSNDSSRHISVDGRSITNDIIRQIATYLPAMTDFRLDIQTDTSITALQCLGELCTKLETCSLTGTFDLEGLRRPTSTPLFPQLRTLKLSYVSNDFSFEQAKSMIRQHSPNLASLTISAGNRSSLLTWEISEDSDALV